VNQFIILTDDDEKHRINLAAIARYAADLDYIKDPPVLKGTRVVFNDGTGQTFDEKPEEVDALIQALPENEYIRQRLEVAAAQKAAMKASEEYYQQLKAKRIEP
jgi:hypothetical protein